MGLGLALGNTEVVGGAFLLFLTNFAAISFAAIVVFALLGFRPAHLEERWHGLPRSALISAGLVLMITVPLVLLTLRFVSEARLAREVQTVVRAELTFLPGAELIEVRLAQHPNNLEVDITARALRAPIYAEVVAFQNAVATRLQQAVALKLHIVPVMNLDPLIPPTFTPTSTQTLTPSPGPSATPTLTPTPLPTLPPTATPTASASATAINTATPTLTPSPTLLPGLVVNTNGSGVYLRDAPGGRPFKFLAQGTLVDVLSQRAVVRATLWLEVRVVDVSGWLPAQYLAMRP